MTQPGLLTVVFAGLRGGGGAGSPPEGAQVVNRSWITSVASVSGCNTLMSWGLTDEVSSYSDYDVRLRGGFRNRGLDIDLWSTWSSFKDVTSLNQGDVVQAGRGG
jgi:hypothetical protein